MTQNRDHHLSAAFHDAEIRVGPHRMRPITLASYDVMLRTENPFMSGAMPQDGTPEFTAAVMGFVFAHCAPWPEVVRASFDAQRFREDALLFCGDLEPDAFRSAFEALEAQGAQLSAAQVEVQGGTPGKKSRPATSPAT
jgi:hypothetical protein